MGQTDPQIPVAVLTSFDRSHWQPRSMVSFEKISLKHRTSSLQGEARYGKSGRQIEEVADRRMRLCIGADRHQVPL